MAKKVDMMTRVGSWSFTIGLLIAVVFGVLGSNVYNVGLILVLLGLIVGILNITNKETIPFLIAVAALILAGNAGLENLPVVGEWLKDILGNIKIFVAPAAVFVSVKAVYDLAKSA